MKVREIIGTKIVTMVKEPTEVYDRGRGFRDNVVTTCVVMIYSPVYFLSYL